MQTTTVTTPSALLSAPAPSLDIAARKAIVKRVYEARRDRVTHPEGETDKRGRWYPSVRESAGGSGTSTRSPSAAWPWSYMHRCRTRLHVAILVERGLAGLDVPADVHRAIREAAGAKS